ncbi:MAG: hypothetical protein ACYSR0_13070 [Planctomycetota bacterium]|jgi:hypothetical protein
MIITLFASIGFVLAVTTFMSGFINVAKKPEQQVETIMHKVNGYLTITMYIVVAVLSIANGTKAFYLFAWGAGLAIHLLKILLVKKRLAVRYGGYFGALLLVTWVIVIFTHLPG